MSEYYGLATLGNGFHVPFTKEQVETPLKTSDRTGKTGGGIVMLRVYPASKLKHGAMWRKLCEDTSGIFLHARWLKHDRIHTPDTSDQAVMFWPQDVQDIKTADVVFVYAEKDDHLRGALVEAGIAIATGVPVVVIGNHPDYGTWQYHPLVVRALTIEKAIEYSLKVIGERNMK